MLNHVKFFLPNSLHLHEKRKREGWRRERKRQSFIAFSVVIRQLQKPHCSSTHTVLSKTHCSPPAADCPCSTQQLVGKLAGTNELMEKKGNNAQNSQKVNRPEPYVCMSMSARSTSNHCDNIRVHYYKNVKTFIWTILLILNKMLQNSTKSEIFITLT